MKLLRKFKFSLPPLPTAPPAHKPERGTLLLLAGMVGIAATVHFLLGHLVIASYGLAIWIMKAIAVSRLGPTPPRWLIMILTVMSFVLVLVFYGGWNGQKAGISFLVLLSCLKFLESQSLRDYYLVCLILLFLASSTFLFNASILSIAAVMVYTILTVALMVRLSDPTSEQRTPPVRTSAVILLKALPLAILLFFFFPRVHGDFGFIPSQDELQGDNRLDDSLVAGDFANSAFSNEPAFRVEFEGSPPAKSRLYWRAKVMQDERNFAWEIRRPDAVTLRDARDLPDRASTGPLLRYQLIHEPSQDKYLPYLDYALNPDRGIQLPNFSVLRVEQENGVFAYNGVATLAPNMPEYGSTGGLADRAALLQTTSQPSARLLRLLSEWRSQTSDPTDLVNLVLNYFRANNFEYTLNPPGLNQNPVDEFMFETRSGYCEHYASAFTIIMRWLGVPARVVVGYQGGNWNEVGGYMQVRYSDAHAWSEVWLGDRWARVDPTITSTLGEQRISQGMEALLSMWEEGGFSQDASLTDYLNPSGYQQALRKLQQSWDNLGYQWNKWIINYDFQAQKALLATLGLEHRNSLYTLLGLMAAGTLGLMLFYFWQLIPKAVKRGEAQQVYLQFVARLGKFNLKKHPSETPLEFATRAKQTVPWHQQQIDTITAKYVQLRYGRNPTDVAELKQLVKAFKPRKQHHSKST
jgi:transglutaminase-like putative cysteine protease